MLHTLFYFIIAIGVLIAFHEFGHFWVARRCGVKVLRFSIGFGKPLWQYRKAPDDTEYVLAAIPLGGYVKMLDEREGPVKSEDLPYAFNRQSLPVRTAIVLAGPLFNLLLAVLLYWVVFVAGETGFRPVIGPVAEGSYAAVAGFQAGDEILTVNGKAAPTWSRAMSLLVTEVMDDDKVAMTVESLDGMKYERVLSIPAEVSSDPDAMREQVGLTFWEPNLPPRLDLVLSGDAAENAGLQKDDLVISTDGVPVKTWQQWVEYIRQRPGEELQVVVERNGMQLPIKLRPKPLETKSGVIGRIGATVAVPPGLFDSMQVTFKMDAFSALGAALSQTRDYSLLTLKMIGRMLIGKASVENLSGPISIAQYAGQSASLGLTQFLKFLALVSLSLGVLNLLPIPVLDGGHLLFYMIEAIKGSPLPEQVQWIFQQIGIVILIFLVGLAFFLDIGRLLS